MRRPSIIERLSSLANFAVPKHSGLMDLEFDSFRSIRTAIGPAFSDPLILLTSAAQWAAYASYFWVMLSSIDSGCATPLSFLGRMLPWALALQVIWGVKAVLLLDKAQSQRYGMLSAIYRAVRTGFLALPFSFLPAWVIGCLAWPFVPIALHGSGRFYDQALVIGQYVQNSLWYIGGKHGSLGENVDAFCDITITSRSRYWDIAAEATVFNLGGFVFAGVLLAIGYVVMRLELGVFPRPSDYGVTLPPLSLATMLYLVAVAMSIIVINTSAIAATSILEYCRLTRQVRLEEKLPHDNGSAWARYIPHAIVGSIFLVLIGTQLLPKSLHLACETSSLRAMQQFNNPFR